MVESISFVVKILTFQSVIHMSKNNEYFDIYLRSLVSLIC